MLLPNGKVLVAGGLCHATRSAELYDPGTGAWTLTGSLVSEEAEHTATLLPNGKVLVAGFYSGNSVDAELYDPATGIWSPTGNLSTQRFEHTATLLENGTVLVVAGQGNSFVLGSGELYDPMSETWSAVQNEVSPARTLHTATLLPNCQVLVARGAAAFGQVFNSAQLYIGEPTPPILLNSFHPHARSDR